MSNRRYRTIASIYIIVASLAVANGQGAVEKEPLLDLKTIQNRLTFRSHIRESDEDVNKQLISDIRKRGVKFVLSEKDIKALKKAGGSKDLIKAINESIPPKLKRLIELDTIYRENYDSRSVEQRKKAIDAGKEILRDYSDYPEIEGLVEYLKIAIPKLEDWIRRSQEIRDPRSSSSFSPSRVKLSSTISIRSHSSAMI